MKSGINFSDFYFVLIEKYQYICNRILYYLLFYFFVLNFICMFAMSQSLLLHCCIQIYKEKNVVTFHIINSSDGWSKLCDKKF